MPRPLKTSTAGPSATARKIAVKTSSTVERTSQSTYSRPASAATVKKTRATARGLSPLGSTARNGRSGPGRAGAAAPAIARPRSGTRRRSAAAAQEAAERGDAAAEDEAGDRRSDHHLRLVARNLLAPVGHLGDLAPQALERDRELHAVGLDRTPD